MSFHAPFLPLYVCLSVCLSLCLSCFYACHTIPHPLVSASFLPFFRFNLFLCAMPYFFLFHIGSFVHPLLNSDHFIRSSIRSSPIIIITMMSCVIKLFFHSRLFSVFLMLS